MRRSRAVASFLRLSGREKLICLQFAVAIGLLEIAVRTVPFPRLVGMVRVRAARGSRLPLGRRQISGERLAQLAIGATDFLCGDNGCMRRSLLLLWLMQSDHPRTALVIGVPRKRVQAFKAHAWIEIDNVPYCESASNLEELTVLGRY